MNTDNLPKQYAPHETEAKWQKRWEEQGIFVAESKSDRASFSIMIPPPNVTGSLHMGHAFEEALIDALVRYHRMKGFNTLWLPGTDHASIAVSTILDNQLKAEGKKRKDLDRQEYLDRAWQWKAESGSTIVNQLRRLGLSTDWTRERFTMDEGLSHAVVEAFVRLYEDGLIYRGEYLVNWCPASQSAVSDLEVDKKEIQGHLWHFRYPLADGSGHLVVATTRPETMLGDTAVAVNPNDDRYQHIIGKTVMLPLMNREIPIVGDPYVDSEFGTGCVKVTPAHDPNDFEIGQRHHLPSINILNKDGSINENGGEFQGQDRFVARKNVVAKLESLELLEKVEDYVHTVPYSERGKVPVEPFLSTQWFVKIRPLADFALQELDERNSPQFVPEHWSKVYRDWLVKLKDWCISRQLWWGHQIPAWYTPDGEVFVARTEAEALAKAKAKLGRDDIQLEQDFDVLDTWFSSGLWPFSTLGWPAQTDDLATFYPTSTLVTGFDIIFFWVARMTMMAGYFTQQMPFRTVYIHGLIRDENNQKMSKSKNNGIDPLILIDKYGTDALRYALVREVIGAGQDIRLDYNRKTDESSNVETARNFANKLWNASRFVLMSIGDRPSVGSNRSGEITDLPLELSDRWILSRFNRTAIEVNRLFGIYGLGEAARALYEFIWGDLCDYYIELVKSRLQGGDGESKQTAQQVLVAVLDGTLRLLHPFMPHITEEIWQAINDDGNNGDGSDRNQYYLAIQSYPEGDANLVDSDLETQFSLIFETIRTIRNLRSEAEIKPGLQIKVVLQSDNKGERQTLQLGSTYIQNLAKVNDLVITDKEPEGIGQTVAGVVDTVQVLIPLTGVVDLAQLKQKLEKNLAKLEAAIASIQTRLGNEGYVKKAPPEVVATAKAELESSLQQAAILRSRLAQFG
ncbi:valine--tRNA ligase [Pseudanabaena sp. PCC 6802]|uniref:valine--tRNA ligase n=1 Tax=Pseudanabaena sp. PCC 6802 TaxID=118173 RepID=UPI000345D9A9|nr:valine--tRNA ligase [Pseudanabaena sp. PCC 6802]